MHINFLIDKNYASGTEIRYEPSTTRWKDGGAFIAPPLSSLRSRDEDAFPPPFTDSNVSSVSASLRESHRIVSWCSKKTTNATAWDRNSF